MKLDCGVVDIAGRCAFPALTHLTVAVLLTAEFLISLPADQLLSLDVRINRERNNVLSAISKMKNLKSLKLVDKGWERAGDTPSSIFDNMHHLENVQLFAYVCRNEEDDEMIVTLANQNPKLSHVLFCGISLADAALTSLAQLQHLTDVRVPHARKVTTSGVLTLLRGASRNIIGEYAFSPDKVDGHQLLSEIRLMCEERGTTFGAPYSIHSYEFISRA